MRFYFDKQDGTTEELTYEELTEHMSYYQIDDAIDEKIQRPDMELIYETVGGRIRFELDNRRKYVVTYGGKREDGGDAENCVTFTTYTKEQLKYVTAENVKAYAMAHAALNGIVSADVKTIRVYGMR